VESTIAIQETLGHDIKALPQTVRQNLGLAVKLAHQLEDLVARSLLWHPTGFRAALERFWPGARRVGTDGTNLYRERKGWISCEMPEGDGEIQQTMHYSITFGTLLVNGKPVGVSSLTLPSETIQEGKLTACCRICPKAARTRS
jgi:hypothetical protein